MKKLFTRFKEWLLKPFTKKEIICFALINILVYLFIGCFFVDTKAISYDPSVYGVEQYSTIPYIKFDSWEAITFRGSKNGSVVHTEWTEYEEKDGFTHMYFDKDAPSRDLYSTWTFSTSGKQLAPSSLIPKELSNLSFQCTVVYGIGFWNDMNDNIIPNTGQYLHNEFGMGFSKPYMTIYTSPANQGDSVIWGKIVNEKQSFSNEPNQTDFAMTYEVTYEFNFPRDEDTIIYGVWTQCNTNLSEETRQLISNSYGNFAMSYTCNIYDINLGISQGELTTYQKNFLDRLDKYNDSVEKYMDSFVLNNMNFNLKFEDIFSKGLDIAFSDSNVKNGIAFASACLASVFTLSPMYYLIVLALVLGLIGLVAGLKSRGG